MRWGFSLSGLVREYGVLRELLLDVSEEAELQVTPGEVRRLTNFVATAIAEAVDEHTRQEKRLQERMQRSEAWLSTVLQSIGDAVIVTDAEGRAVFLNPVAEALTGWTGSEARGESLTRIFHILHEQTLARVDSPVERVLREGQVQGLAHPTLLVRRDGTHVPIDDSAAPLRDAAGAISGVVLVFRDISEKKRQEAERERLRTLAERERARLGSIIQQAPAAIILLRGPELVMEMPNAEMCRVWGRTREQLEGKTMLEALPELVQQGFDTLLLGVMDSGVPYRATEMPAPVRRPDGTVETCYFNLTYAPWVDEAGAVAGVFAIAMEVTGAVLARREVQAERERTERTRAAMLEALGAQTFVAVAYLRGPELVFETANPLYRQIMGREVVGSRLRQALPEEAGQRFVELISEVPRTGVPFVARELPVPMAREPGGPLREVLLDLIYQPVHAPDGSIDGLLALVVDVTEQVLQRREAHRRVEEERGRRDAETRLRTQAESERARFNALFMQAPVAISVIRGPSLVIEVANPFILRLWGRTAEQVLGKPLLEAMPELTGQPLIDDMREVLASGRAYVGREVPVQLARAEGGAVETGYFTFVYESLRDERGQPEGVLVVSTEVSETVLGRQKVEALLVRSLEAEREERQRRDFEQHLIGIVSHDLRNPLSAISLGLQVLLRREGLDHRTYQSLMRLRSSTERASRMVHDLLDFTQARLGGGLKVERKPVDLHMLVRGGVEELQVTHPERELRLEQRGEARGEWDADRLSQLLGNLVGNALKYSPPDSRVTVRSEGGPEAVWLEIHNGGMPIAPEALPRLFQPLQRAVEGIDKAGRSVGLGLYIVDQIVRAHGGDIQVISTEREGTTFRVRLPRPDFQ